MSGCELAASGLSPAGHARKHSAFWGHKSVVSGIVAASKTRQICMQRNISTILHRFEVPDGESQAEPEMAMVQGSILCHSIAVARTAQYSLQKLIP